MRRNNKKGFTIVELVIVIAAIAILTAVMIPTFSAISKKAQISADTQVVRNLNTALVAGSATGKPATMYEALQFAKEAGYDVKKLNAKANGNEILWDSVNNAYCYFNGDKISYEYVGIAKKDKVEDWQYWVISNEYPLSTKYSTYYYGNETVIETTKGFDAGENTNITAVNYTNTGAAQDVVIRTKGDRCVLTIDAANDNVDFYGFAKKIDAKAVKDASLHIYGATAQLAIEKGHAVVEPVGIVFDIVQVGTVAEGTGATVTNNGYVAAATLVNHIPEGETAVPAAILAKVTDSENPVVKGTVIGGDYEIATLAQLEAFRDAVNAGNNFAGKTVKLTADIKLNDGWTPIGEGSRAVGASGTPADGITTFFAGTFDGQGHTISNLNNKGFEPTAARLVKDDGVDTYAYGLFALVSGATIKDVKLANVAIDTTTYTAANGDSVGALVGYSNGALDVSGIEVTGSVKAGDAVGGIVGRCYNKTGVAATASITNCVNKANVTAGTEKGQKAAGILGYTSGCAFVLTGNTNEGTIAGGAAYTGTSAKTYVAGGEGTYVLNAKIAVVAHSAVGTTDGTRTGSASSTDIID